MSFICSKSGFTLAELLVVVSILSILSTSAIVGTVNVSRRASYTRVYSDIQHIREGIEIARINSGRRLGVPGADTAANTDITNSPCTECECRVYNGANNTSTDIQCWNSYRLAIDRINAQAGYEVIKGYPRDPWGSPYLINENEGESDADCPDTNGDGFRCCTDSIGSAGPDHQTFLTLAAEYGPDDIVRNFSPLCKPMEGSHHPDQN